MAMHTVLKLHKNDNVIVALQNLKGGERNHTKKEAIFTIKNKEFNNKKIHLFFQC